MRAYKTVNDAYIEPIHFVVPRRAEVFQNDIYPPTTGTKPAVTSDEFFAGKTGLPPKISLESVYEGEGPVEIPAEQAPSASAVKDTPAPNVTPSTKPEPQAQSNPSPSQPEPSEQPRTAPSGSLNDSKASMSSMASRFADKDDDDEADDSSSFEEIPRPAERPRAALVERQEEKIGVKTPPQASTLQISPTKTSTAPSPVPESAPAIESSSSSADQVAPKAEQDAAESSGLSGGLSSRSTAAGTTTAGGGSKGAAEGIKGVLQEIRAMIAQQGRQVAEQGEKIEILAREVAAMKARLGD